MAKMEGLDKLITQLQDRVKRSRAAAVPEVHVIVEAPYALVVHENLEAAHGAAYNQKHAADIAAGRDHARRPQEQAKYIETPLRDTGLVVEMRSAVHEALGSGGTLTDGLAAAGEVLLDAVREIIPIDTGVMVESMRVEVK